MHTAGFALRLQHDFLSRADSLNNTNLQWPNFTDFPLISADI